MIDQIVDGLNAIGLEVERVGDLLNVQRGSGVMAQKTNVDPTTFAERLEGADSDVRRSVAAYARGVETTLLEPRHSDASDWAFVEAAGSLLPVLTVESFAQGVRDATGGDPGYTEPFAEELVLAWTLRLDRGMRPVTRDQFEGWGVTRDRLRSAGRSLLFHRTRHVDWKSVGDGPVLKARAGDGHDAARILVVEDVWFIDVDRNWRYAMPTPDVLLAVETPAAVDELARITSTHFETANEPLSNHIWRLTKDGPVRADVDEGEPT